MNQMSLLKPYLWWAWSCVETCCSVYIPEIMTRWDWKNYPEPPPYTSAWEPWLHSCCPGRTWWSPPVERRLGTVLAPRPDWWCPPVTRSSLGVPETSLPSPSPFPSGIRNAELWARLDSGHFVCEVSQSSPQIVHRVPQSPHHELLLVLLPCPLLVPGHHQHSLNINIMFKSNGEIWLVWGLRQCRLFLGFWDVKEF